MGCLLATNVYSMDQVRKSGGGRERAWAGRQRNPAGPPATPFLPRTPPPPQLLNVCSLFKWRVKPTDSRLRKIYSRVPPGIQNRLSHTSLGGDTECNICWAGRLEARVPAPGWTFSGSTMNLSVHHTVIYRVEV